MKKVEEINKLLVEYRVEIDDRDEVTPGFKFNEWELKGVPIRIEIGPRDIENNKVIISRRDIDDSKKDIPIDKLTKEITQKEQKLLSLLSKKRNISNSEIMDLFLEKDKTKDFAIKKKNKTIASLNEKLLSVFKIEFICKKKSKSDSRQLTYFLFKK